MKRLLIIIFALSTTFVLQAKADISLKSPDGQNVVTISTRQSLSYSITRNGVSVLDDSPISMCIESHLWGGADKQRGVKRRSIQREVSFTIARKYAATVEKFNEVTLQYKDYDVVFRAYNDGVAYRFVGKNDRVATVDSETIAFNFAEDNISYTLLVKELQNWFEERYTKAKLSEIPQDSISMIPVMVKTLSFSILLAEANLYNYPGMYLRANGRGFDGVLAEYPKVEEYFDNCNKLYATQREEYLLQTNLDRSFPWRVVGIFDKEIDILNSELIYLLSDKTTDDYSWVKSGQVLWDWWNNRNNYGVDFVSGINTETYLYMIDVASGNGVEFILIDEGWSGKNDITQMNPDVDMKRICQYAESKNVDVLLWAKWTNVLRQKDEFFKLVGDLGAKGVKIDFMDRNDAKMVNFYEDVAKAAQQYKLTVDFHGAYPNEGMRAKYPHLLTREGVVGLEYNRMKADYATPQHDLIIPFIRMWAGPMDYTPGSMLNAHREDYRQSAIEPMSLGTRAHQIAMYVVYESPLQMLSDSATKYLENKECFDFMTRIPTTWDITTPLFGAIGENIGVARQKDGVWYVGVMGGEKAQTLTLDFAFLNKDTKYKIEAIADGVNSEVNAKDYKYATSNITSSDRVRIQLSRGGGYCAIITPNN